MANASTIPEEEKATTSDVADGIRQRIRLGRYVPGQRLIEGDLIRETGASRSRVREALQRLAIEGLITIEEFRGASVKRITWDEVRQIYACASAGKAEPVQFGNGLRNSLRAAIRHVIARKREHIKSGVHERSQIVRICARRWDIEASLFPTPAMRHLQMADHKRRPGQRGRDAREPMLRIRHIQNKIARDQNIGRIVDNRIIHG